MSLPRWLRTLWFGLLVAECVLTGVAPALAQRAKPLPVIVDTDVAADDLVALLYVLNSPEIRIVSITTVNGVVSPEAGARNVSRLLVATGHSGIPIASGAEEPLAGDHAFPRAWREAAERLEGVDLPKVVDAKSPDVAYLWIRRTLSESPEKVSILALGPLTNVALALADSPQLCRRIERVVWLGGAAYVRGNVDPLPGTAKMKTKSRPRREWNAYIDPLAAQRVFDSGCRIEMVPLDAVYQFPLEENLVARVEHSAHSLRGRVAGELLRRLYGSPWQDGRAYVADAVAALALTHPALFRESALRVEVATSGGNPGETRIVPQAQQPNARVALALDARAAKRLLLKRLSAGPEGPQKPGSLGPGSR